jgi:predicted Rossmann-fold nucleotide-binding protein
VRGCRPIIAGSLSARELQPQTAIRKFPPPDAFVAMPGGIGTLEEFFEVWTWIQLGQIKKPIGVLNTDGFFEPLLAFIDQLVEQRFIRVEHRNLLVVESSPSQLVTRLGQCQLPDVEKWVDR